jgi:hypothetical protein
MTDDQIRSLVREVIATRSAPQTLSVKGSAEADRSVAESAEGHDELLGHASQALRCVHCGYCQTFGH